MSAKARTRQAKSKRSKTVKRLFDDAGVAFPPQALLLRGFKNEERLEVWAGDDRKAALTHVTTYEFCYASGELGPKRAQGDEQVPEGFYSISALNPASRYHLSLKVSYPNRSDRILGSSNLGGFIMLHGDCVSIGCIALSDERIEELWLMVAPVFKAKRKVDVHLFPSADMSSLLASHEDNEHHAFWANLKEGFDRFEHERRIVRPKVDRAGKYVFPTR